ncbi:MAG TPA: amino acid ABC transporter substrate-binding protein [Nocardioidaceae bacterium]|nr:amino acid ABC transporter substrate-binding protein [Nocardioidaceae bacterium]
MTSRSRVALATIATCALVTTAGCGSKGSSEGSTDSDTLTLGASLSLTGSLAREGQLTKEGYQLCQQKVNEAGGVDLGDKKVKLKIKYQDDTSTPDVAAQLVDQFNDQGIKLILSSYGSANVEAQAAVIERNGQVMADSAGANNEIFTKGYKRTFAVLSPATEYAASIVKAIDELAQPRPKSMAFLSADDGFSQTGAEGGSETAKKLGFDVLPIESFPAGSTDVSSSLNKIKGENPDVIIGTVHVEEGVAIVKQSKELGLKPDGFGETVAPPTPDFAKSLGDAANGVLGSSQWTDTSKGSDKYFGSAKDYAADINEKFGHVPDYHDAEASAACLAIVLAAEEAGSVDADKVRDAMADLDTESFFGKIKFDETGQNVYKPMSVIQIQDGKVVTVWPKEAAEADLVWPGTK